MERTASANACRTLGWLALSIMLMGGWACGEAADSQAAAGDERARVEKVMSGDSCGGSGELAEAAVETRQSAVVTSCETRPASAWDRGRNVGDISVVEVDGKPVEIDTATAYIRMQQAAAREGVPIRIVSGFRTYAQQEYLYGCYRCGCCNNGNLAARPGYSNHQDGQALDLNTRNRSVLNWMRHNARRFGFLNTVPSEPWHWEYRGPRPVTPRVCEPRERYQMDLGASFHGAMIDRGLSVSSASIPAVFNHVPRGVTAELLLTNRGNTDLENVVIGYWFETPYLRPVAYRIEDDHPQHDKRSWELNSADSDTQNPPDGQLGTTGFLRMHKFAAGESKRVVVEFDAGSSSISLAHHPDVRFWVKHIDGKYGEQTDFFGSPTNGNVFGTNLRDYAQLDVLDRNAWHFAGDHRSDTLGWSAGGTVEELKLNMNYDTLAVRTNGDDPFVISPEWTQIKPWRWDEMVLRLRSHNGPHSLSVYWAHEDEGFSEAKSIHVEIPKGDSQFRYAVIPIGSHPAWEDGDRAIRRLRIDPHNGRNFTASESRWYDIKAAFFQQSSNMTSGSDVTGYIDGPRVGVRTDFVGQFADDDGTEYEQDIELLHDAGVVSGCGGGTVYPRFCPRDQLSRSQLAAMLVRAFPPGVNVSSDRFGDIGNHLLKDEINKAAVAGYMEGCGSGNFCPDSDTTVGELALGLLRGAEVATNGQVRASGMTQEDAIDTLRQWQTLDRSSCSNPAACKSESITRGETATVFANMMAKLGLL